MRRLALSVCVAAVLAGCGGPVVAIRHTLPPALPMPDDVGVPRAGQVEVVAVQPSGRIDADQQAASLKGCLAAHLPADGDAAATVDGEMHLSIEDVAGERTIRRWDTEAGQTKDLVVETLVRKVDSRVDFTVRRNDGTIIGEVEVRRSYSSANDPRVRGELGLGRGDDPANVPTVETILGEQCVETAEELAGLLKPVDVAADIELFPVGGPQGQAGIKAAEQGDYAAAADAFQAALAERDDPPLRFNLAVTAEAAGRVKQAAEIYAAVVENGKLPKEKLDIARLGEARSRRVGQSLQQASANGQ